MHDNFDRNIDYLRLSVTDLCNLRCIYCMPEAGVKKLDHKEILSPEEIDEIIHAAARLGVSKLRLTGGEPLVRRGIETIIRNAAATPGISEVCLTTNGSLLAEKARDLKEAGLSRVNISLDTLDPTVYREITRFGDLSKAMEGIRAAIAAGLTPIKINTVLMGGLNEDSIDELIELTKEGNIHLRFIEIMPIGECADWNKSRFVSADEILRKEPDLKYVGTKGVSKLYKKDGHKGTVGIISPISNHFCPDCNKIRVTSDGKLKPCLHSPEEIALRGLHGEELSETIRQGILSKPYKHMLSESASSKAMRNMNAIGG